MATFKSSTFGKISGKFGEALATQSKATGKNYLRVASIPTNPRTPKQVEHRARFGYINQVLRAFYPIYKATFGGNTGIRYGINIAFANAIQGTNPDFSLDYSQLRFTEGALYQSNNVSATKSGTDSLKVDWDFYEMAGNNASDTVSIIIYNETADQVIMKQAVALREATTATVQLPDVWVGGNMQCWLFFTAPNGTTFSNSQYINAVQF